MDRLMLYWENAGGLVAAFTFCIVVIVDLMFGWVLEWVWSRQEIEQVWSESKEEEEERGGPEEANVDIG